jgi:hypothetical protein
MDPTLACPTRALRFLHIIDSSMPSTRPDSPLRLTALIAALGPCQNCAKIRIVGGISFIRPATAGASDHWKQQQKVRTKRAVGDDAALSHAGGPGFESLRAHVSDKLYARAARRPRPTQFWLGYARLGQSADPAASQFLARTAHQ